MDVGFSDTDFMEQGMPGTLRWLSYHFYPERTFSVQVKGFALFLSLVHIQSLKVRDLTAQDNSFELCENNLIILEGFIHLISGPMIKSGFDSVKGCYY